MDLTRLELVKGAGIAEAVPLCRCYSAEMDPLSPIANTLAMDFQIDLATAAWGFDVVHGWVGSDQRLEEDILGHINNWGAATAKRFIARARALDPDRKAMP